MWFNWTFKKSNLTSKCHTVKLHISQNNILNKDTESVSQYLGLKRNREWEMTQSYRNKQVFIYFSIQFMTAFKVSKPSLLRITPQRMSVHFLTVGHQLNNTDSNSKQSSEAFWSFEYVKWFNFIDISKFLQTTWATAEKELETAPRLNVNTTMHTETQVYMQQTGRQIHMYTTCLLLTHSLRQETTFRPQKLMHHKPAKYYFRIFWFL